MVSELGIDSIIPGVTSRIVLHYRALLMCMTIIIFYSIYYTIIDYDWCKKYYIKLYKLTPVEIKGQSTLNSK